jgi:ribosomal protein L22
MKVTSTTRKVRMSPKKVREVTRQLLPRKNKRGKKVYLSVDQAHALLSAIPRKSARLVAKALQTAIHDAAHIRGEWSEGEIMDKAGKLRERIQDHTNEDGKLQRKFRGLKAQLARYEDFIDSDKKLAEEQLVVVEATAGAGTPLRRWRTRARGGGSPIIKRTSHIRITIADKPAE